MHKRDHQELHAQIHDVQDLTDRHHKAEMDALQQQLEVSATTMIISLVADTYPRVICMHEWTRLFMHQTMILQVFYNSKNARCMWRVPSWKNVCSKKLRNWWYALSNGLHTSKWPIHYAGRTRKETRHYGAAPHLHQSTGCPRTQHSYKHVTGGSRTK